MQLLILLSSFKLGLTWFELTSMPNLRITLSELKIAKLAD